MSDVEDLAVTYGVARNATVSPGGPVRPLCIVKVGGEVVMKDLPNLVASLRYLRDFGLLPVVVHGGGPQLNDELAKAGVQPQYIGGHRVTDAPTMAVAKWVFESANGQLAAALRDAGLPVEQFLGGVFKAEVADPKLGLVGEIKSIDAARVNEAIASGRIPVLTSLGFRSSMGPGEDGTLNINADVAARELAIALKPLRVVFISAGGGWKENGTVIEELNMAEDYERMAARDYTGRQGTLLKLNEMKKITDRLPGVSSVTQCSASALSAQLLPHKGPGTQIRRGTKISRLDSTGAVDRPRLESLLLSVGAEATAKLFHSPPPSTSVRVYVTEDYDGAAVVCSSLEKGSFPTLSAMALTPTAMASAVEGALWKRLKSDYPVLCWRASRSAPIDVALESVRKSGPAQIPLAFPALSVNRAGEFAEGSTTLGDDMIGMWWGVEGDKTGENVMKIIEELKKEHQKQHTRNHESLQLPVTVKSLVAPPVLPSRVDGKARSIRVGLMGARGYVGRELLSLLAGHPDLQVVCASSRALVGKPVAESLGVPNAETACVPGLLFSDVGPEQLRKGQHPAVDVWVLALPNGLCDAHEEAIAQHCKSSGTPTPLLLDLSADQRFKPKGGPWVYGLPERPGSREALRTARKIANPGCYATGSQAALLPLLPAYGGSIQWNPSARPHIFGISGYSGAGTTPSDKNNPDRLRWVSFYHSFLTFGWVNQ